MAKANKHLIRINYNTCYNPEDEMIWCSVKDCEELVSPSSSQGYCKTHSKAWREQTLHTRECLRCGTVKTMLRVNRICDDCKQNGRVKSIYEEFAVSIPSSSPYSE
jgi:Zn ribbon nucleic-acid-binding protein